MSRVPAFLLLLIALGLLSGQAPAPEAVPPPAVRRVLLISVDGLRPDLLLRTDTPEMHALMQRGCSSLMARTTELSVTLPSHVSMLTGVQPPKHGITWNNERPGVPKWPTLFELAHRAGYTTAMAAGKAKFSTLAVPGTLDWCSVPRRTIQDSTVVDTALSWIECCAPELLFVHLPSPDRVGHRSGWGSDPQIATIEEADRQIGRLLAALRARGLLDSTVVLVTSDHGGSGTRHGPDDPLSRHIPWIVAGPGIRGGLDLARDSVRVIDTEDTFATLCSVLRIPILQPVDGRPVDEIFLAPAVTGSSPGANPPR